MPSTSAKQAKFMRAVAHSPKFAKKVGVKQSVGKDFEMADKKTKKFNSGGSSYPIRMDLDKLKAATTARDRARPAKPITQRDLDRHARLQGEEAKELNVMKTKAKGGKCYAKGGSASSRADGIAKKGKTKGKMLAVGGPAGMPSQSASGLGRAATASGRTFKKGGAVKKMAMGGIPGRPDMTGLDRAAAMSGRTMPTTGRPDMTALGRAADVSGRAMPMGAGADARGRAMPVTTMKKGGKTKKGKY